MGADWVTSCQAEMVQNIALAHFKVLIVSGVATNFPPGAGVQRAASGNFTGVSHLSGMKKISGV